MDRQEFMDFIYSEFESDSDNVRANRIIEAADGYAESARLAEVDTDCISRQAALDCVTYDEEYTMECIEKLPLTQPDIKQAAKLLLDFIESCPGGESYLITPNGEELRTDWGYAMEGIQLIHNWAERKTDG